MEDGSFVTTDRIRESANRLVTALKAVAEGTLKPEREKDELTYALGTPEHTGCVPGMGVVPWKHGFSAYQSRCRRKAEQEDKMHALEELVASIEGAMAASQRLQEAPSAPNMESSRSSQHRSSVASTEHPAGGDQTEMVVDNQQRYPMDDITVRTPCELLYQ
jgi:hypothetical protein